MRKTTLEIDDTVLDEARRVLGTRGIKDTVDAALHEVLSNQARRELVVQLSTHDGLDLARPDVMREAWR